MTAPSLSQKSFFGAAIGSMIEYYDYALFSCFLPIMSPLFFPTDSAYESLVKSYSVLLIAMVARPLGGIVFGFFGDTVSRRSTLLKSMYGIAIATFVIGITPSYASIGVLAMVIMIVAKSVQHFCFGGEYNGAGIYIVEQTLAKPAVLQGSLLTAFTVSGSLIAALLGIVLTLPGMPDWSWRIAFMLGGLLGVLGILYRKNMVESPGFKPARQNTAAMFKQYPRELLAGVFAGAFSTVPFTTVMTFIVPVLMTKGVITKLQLMLLQTFFTTIAILGLVIVGWIGNKKPPEKIMRLGSVLLILLAYPLTLMVDQAQWILLLPALSLLIIINEILLAPTNAFFKNIFPMAFRYRGSSLSFCFGMAVFGGLTPVVENYLYQKTGQFSAISIWLIAIGVATFFSLQSVASRRDIESKIKANTPDPATSAG